MTSDASASVWSTTDLVLGASKDLIASSVTAGTNTDLTAAVYGQTSLIPSATSLPSTATNPNQYYNTSYPNYTMYTSANPTYYQQAVSNIRMPNAAFGYNFPGSYPIDYSAYANPQCYRASYAGYTFNPTAFQTVASSLNTDSSTSAVDMASISAFKEKKVKAKKKKTGSCSPGDETYSRVFIWDIDDVSTLSRNTIAHFNAQYQQFSSAGVNLHRLLESIVRMNFSDQAELLEGDVTNIEDAVVDDSVIDGPIDNLRGLDIMRRIVPKYASLRQLYQQISSKIEEDFKGEKPAINYELLERCGFSGQESEFCQSAVQYQTLFMQRWQCAGRCLALVPERSAISSEKYANVVMCNEGIAYGAAQLLVSGHAASIPIENIYSTSKTSKEAIFEKLVSRYGKKCSFVAVTSSAETTSIAKKFSFPVWPIAINEDFERLFTAQRDFLLG